MLRLVVASTVIHNPCPQLFTLRLINVPYTNKPFIEPKTRISERGWFPRFICTNKHQECWADGKIMMSNINTRQVNKAKQALMPWTWQIYWSVSQSHYTLITTLFTRTKEGERRKLALLISARPLSVLKTIYIKHFINYDSKGFFSTVYCTRYLQWRLLIIMEYYSKRDGWGIKGE